MSKYIDILFDGPPSHESGRFVEVESDSKKSISFGEWVERDDGYWALRITRIAELEAENERLQARVDELSEEHGDMNVACVKYEKRIAKLEAVWDVSRQFMGEVAHAMESGPGWYTRGEDGLRQQVRMWIGKMQKALAAAEQEGE